MIEQKDFGCFGKFKNRLFAWWQKRMSKKDKGVGIGKVALAVVGAWVLFEILKSGLKGEDATIHRCGNCNMVLKPRQSPCPNCGYELIWN